MPETPPNFRPPSLADDLVPDANGDLVSTTVLSVTFAVGATQAERQAAIDLVDGTVIGGLNRRGDGWYYVRVEGDGTIETIFEIAHTVDALPQVYLAAPYIEWGRVRTLRHSKRGRAVAEAAPGRHHTLDAPEYPLIAL